MALRFNVAVRFSYYSYYNFGFYIIRGKMVKVLIYK